MVVKPLFLLLFIATIGECNDDDPNISEVRELLENLKGVCNPRGTLFKRDIKQLCVMNKMCVCSEEAADELKKTCFRFAKLDCPTTTPKDITNGPTSTTSERPTTLNGSTTPQNNTTSEPLSSTTVDPAKSTITTDCADKGCVTMSEGDRTDKFENATVAANNSSLPADVDYTNDSSGSSETTNTIDNSSATTSELTTNPPAGTQTVTTYKDKPSTTIPGPAEAIPSTSTSESTDHPENDTTTISTEIQTDSTDRSTGTTSTEPSSPLSPQASTVISSDTDSTSTMTSTLATSTGTSSESESTSANKPVLSTYSSTSSVPTTSTSSMMNTSITSETSTGSTRRSTTSTSSASSGSSTTVSYTTGNRTFVTGGITLNCTDCDESTPKKADTVVPTVVASTTMISNSPSSSKMTDWTSIMTGSSSAKTSTVTESQLPLQRSAFLNRPPR